MVTNYYNASNNYSTPIRREPKPYIERHEEFEHIQQKQDSSDLDRVLLLGLLAVLYITNCDDIWLMLALLYLAFG